MAKASGAGRRRKKPIPVSLSSTDTYTTARHLTEVLRSRTLASIVAQPPSFLFIVCLLLVTVLLPLLGLYVSHATSIPDLDAMMKWTLWSGDLRKSFFCLDGTTNGSTTPPLIAMATNCSSDTSSYQVAEAGVRVKVSHDSFPPSNDVTWVAHMSRKDLAIDINGEDSNCIFVELSIPFQPGSCSHGVCDACLTITIPSHINHQLLNNKPVLSCPKLNTTITTTYSQLYLRQSSSCHSVAYVTEEYRHHGGVLVYLTQEESRTSARRLYLCALLGLLATVLFTIATALMDKPLDNRPSNE